MDAAGRRAAVEREAVQDQRREPGLYIHDTEACAS